MTLISTPAITAATVTPKVPALTDTQFNQSGTRFMVQPVGNSGVVHTKLPAGNYAIKFAPMIGFFLEMISDFPPMGKIYGNAMANAERVLTTYHAKKGNLGVLLDGLKGSGKTLLARLISVEGAKIGIPTLIINTAYAGEDFFQFLYSIQQECIVLFDEFEKVYDDKDQQSLLTVLDGTFPSKKLFLLTSNDQSKINGHLKNRPGRIHYYLKFKGLSGEFIREYVADNLNNKSHEQELLSVCGLFTSMNFDSLSAIVWEMNLHREPAGQAIRMLNAKPESEANEIFDIELHIPGLKAPLTGDFTTLPYYRGNPISMKELQIFPKIPLSPEDGFNMFGITRKMYEETCPEALESYEECISEAKTTNVKLKLDDNPWVDDWAYIGRARIPLVRTDNHGGEIFDGKKFNFSSSNIINIDIEKGSFVFENEHKILIVATRRKEVVTGVDAYLSTLAY
jgi:hypothetical protein